MSESKISPLVSIITVNYNQNDVTIDFLNSIAKINYPNFEVVVVDNGSEIAFQYDKKSNRIKIIRSEQNLGFAGGNNLGINVASGSYYLLINNDTEVESDFLEPMVKQMEMHSNIGIISPKIIYYGTDIVQYAGYTKVNPLTGRNRTIGLGKRDSDLFNKINETYYPHGAAMLVNKNALKIVGLMPEEYFLYYEELAWGELFRKKGFKIFYNPYSKIFHKESISIGNKNPLKEYYISRNRILFMKNFQKNSHLIVFYLFLVLFSIPKTTLLKLAKLEVSQLKAFYKGILWNIKN